MKFKYPKCGKIHEGEVTREELEKYKDSNPHITACDCSCDFILIDNIHIEPEIKPDGGSAYPYTVKTGEGQYATRPGTYDLIEHSHGMTLRDYFAGQALVGMLSNPKFMTSIDNESVDGNDAARITAALAGIYADAMIKERNND